MEEPLRWITRERPKIDRIACPWLVARFIDPEPEFFFAPTAEVLERATTTGATPFDIEGAVLSHRGDRCSFDAFLDDYHLGEAALLDLALIVRGADTDRLDLAPQSAGLLAVSLGISRLCLDDDHRALAHGFVVYDALYEWLCHARGERHGWAPDRGSGEPTAAEFHSHDLVINLPTRRVAVGGRSVSLRAKEFDLLVALVAREGRVLSRGFLLQRIWQYAPDVTSRTVDWHVASLRRRLGPSGEFLETVRGGGYRWIGSPEQLGECEW